MQTWTQCKTKPDEETIKKILQTNASAGIRRTHTGAIHQLRTTKCPVWNGCNCSTRCTYTYAQCTVVPTATDNYQNTVGHIRCVSKLVSISSPDIFQKFFLCHTLWKICCSRVFIKLPRHLSYIVTVTCEVQL